MRIVVIDYPEPRDVPRESLAWLENWDSGGSYSFRARQTTVTCLGVVVQRAAAEKENLSELAKVTIARSVAESEFDFLTNETDRRITICTADELVQLCYWMRDTRTPTPCERPMTLRDHMGFDDKEPAFLFALGYTRWCVKEVRVLGPGKIEYARWTADELAAAVAEMRATARRPPVDPAELPGGDGEI